MADFQKVQEASNGKKRRPPEFDRYDELKGKQVVVVLGTNSVDGTLSPTLHGVLRWVCDYTIGVFVESSQGLPGRGGQVWIVNKAYVVMIGEE